MINLMHLWVQLILDLHIRGDYLYCIAIKWKKIMQKEEIILFKIFAWKLLIPNCHNYDKEK